MAIKGYSTPPDLKNRSLTIGYSLILYPEYLSILQSIQSILNLVDKMVFEEENQHKVNIFLKCNL